MDLLTKAVLSFSQNFYTEFALEKLKDEYEKSNASET